MLSAIAPNTCAAVAFESTRPGTPVVTWSCDSTLAARRFALQPSGTLTTQDGSLCLDVMPPKAKGAPVVVWGCASSEQTQHWTRTAAGELTNVQGLCLTIAYEDAQPGRGLVLWPCNGGPAQKWNLRDAN